MFCRKCGKKLNDDSKFCDGCGCKVNEPGNVQDVSNTQPINENQPLVQGVQPNGGYQKKRKKGHSSGCAVVVAIAIMIMIVVITPKIFKGNVNTNPLAEAFNADKEQATNIEATLEQCGIEQLKEISRDELLDHDGLKGYRAKAWDRNTVVYTDENNQVMRVVFGGITLCDNGEVVANVSDYTMTTDEETTLQLKTQEIIKNILKSPSTAKFAPFTEWGFSKNPERIIVQGYVDSQNSFGATLRSEFQITYSPDGVTVTSVIFDGKEYYK